MSPPRASERRVRTVVLSDAMLERARMIVSRALGEGDANPLLVKGFHENSNGICGDDMLGEGGLLNATGMGQGMRKHK